jgi:DNA modification methylase
MRNDEGHNPAANAELAASALSASVEMAADSKRSETAGIVTELAVTYLALTKLRPDPRNARTHSKQQVQQIVASIQNFGFTNPILIDEAAVIIAGHGRFMAAKSLEIAFVPTITLAGLSSAQKRALRLADNKIALGAGWDVEVLKLEFAELGTLDINFDLSVTGFSTGEIDLILKGAADPDDEVVPAVPEIARSQLGDIWQLGSHRIGCGDGRDLGFLQRVVGEGGRADVAFLDPPYNVRINGHANAKGRHPEFAMASGEMTEDEFREFLSDTLGACATVSRSGAVHFVCMDWRHMEDVFWVGGKIYGALLNICVWNKSNAGMGSLYRSKHEMVFAYRVGTQPHHNMVELGKHGRNRTNVWDYASVNSMQGSRRQDLDLHPTVKPVALVADAIQDVSRRGDLVLDIFLGSGTTLIAAERVGRRCCGVELEPGYVDVALARWQSLTGKEPQLVERMTS